MTTPTPRPALMVWILTTTDGRKLNVDMNMKTGKVTMWLDTGGCSPCFDTEAAAQSYINRFASTFGVSPELVNANGGGR